MIMTPATLAADERKAALSEDSNVRFAKFPKRHHRASLLDFAGPAILASLGVLCGSAAIAQPEPWHDHRDHDEHHGWVMDNRFHHDHYYPPRGFVVHSLPPGFVTIRHPQGEFFFTGGVWYSRRGPDFIVVTPPIGVAIGVLPVGYTTVWFGGVPYYYADNVYYTQGPGGYVVAAPPNEAQMQTAPPPPSGPSAEDFFIYPRNQQTPDQQSRDRYECHTWAVSQTGFDTTRPGGGVPPELEGQKSHEYRRAITACLEGRGYTVK